MFDIQKLTVQLDLHEFLNKAFSFIGKMWTGTPAWLRTVFIITILSGLGYLLYCKISDGLEINELKQEVKELNERCSSTVFYDAYLLDISNYATMIECLELELDGLYEQQNYLFDAFIEFVQRTHPHDNLVIELKSLKRQMNFTHEANQKIIQKQIEIFKFNAKRDSLLHH